MYAQDIRLKNDWVEVILGIARFFLEHSEINFNGAEHTASIKYKGPNGWRMSFEASPEVECQGKELLLGETLNSTEVEDASK